MTSIRDRLTDSTFTPESMINRFGTIGLIRFKHFLAGLTATLTVGILVLAATGELLAWNVLEAFQIPNGTAALTLGPQGLWCGTNLAGDSVIRVLDPESGRQLGTFVPPEAVCRGIGLYSASIWFIGGEALYRLDQNGRVTGQFELPYEVMRGLSGGEQGLWTLVRDNGIYYLICFVPGGAEVSRFRTTMQRAADLTLDGDVIWATDPIDGFIHEFNAADGRELDLFPTPAARPTGIAAMEGQLALVDDGFDENSQVLYIIDPAGEPTPKLLPLASYYDFGMIATNEVLNLNFALYNIGGADLNVDTLYLARGDMCIAIGQIQRHMVIRPDAYAIIPMTFRPNSYGRYTDTLIVFSNDPQVPLKRIILTGLGIFSTRSLGLWPAELDFGEVRADPWRDGNRMRRLALFNGGRDDLRIDSLTYFIEDIFRFSPLTLPCVIGVAETINVEFWFEPHRGIEYIDTLRIWSNHRGGGAEEVLMHGQGSDSSYANGSVLWRHDMGGDDGFGAVATHDDVNGDSFDDIVAVYPSGMTACLNGFASDEADVLWQQDFAGLPYRPVGVQFSQGLAANRDLNADGQGDIVIASGGADRAIYSLDGRTGAMMWRFDSRTVNGEGLIVGLEAGQDRNMDGAVDPVALIGAPERGVSRLIRLDGGTGHLVWMQELPSALLLGSIGDLNRDGISDFAAAGSAGQVFFYSGSDGGLLQMFNLAAPAAWLISDDLSGDGRRDLLLAPTAGGLAAWSLASRENLWVFNHIDNNALDVIPFILDIHHDLSGDRINEIACCDEQGFLFVLDPSGPSASWSVRTNRRSTALEVLPDNDGDGHPEVLVGFENGRVQCHSGANGRELWAFSGQEAGWTSALSLLAFKNVDLQGREDFIGLFADRTVRCISSGDEYTSVRSDFVNNPNDFSLIQLYPNPFNQAARLTVNLSRRTQLRLAVYDPVGRLVGEQDLGMRPVGMNDIYINPSDMRITVSGAYYFKVIGADQQLVQRGLYLK
ncbi:MAG: PQQ-binding-like beta-propeller repeat protein [Calditrichota bacterium]